MMRRTSLLAAERIVNDVSTLSALVHASARTVVATLTAIKSSAAAAMPVLKRAMENDRGIFFRLFHIHCACEHRAHSHRPQQHIMRASPSR